MTTARVTPSSNARTRSRSASVITRSSVSGRTSLERKRCYPSPIEIRTSRQAAQSTPRFRSVIRERP
jgi:hypothetical protein